MKTARARPTPVQPPPDDARRESRWLVWQLRGAGYSPAELAAEIAVSVAEVADMLAGQHAATAAQRSKLRALVGLVRARAGS